MITPWVALVIGFVIFGLGVAVGISYWKHKVIQEITQDVDFSKVPARGIVHVDARIGFAFRDGKYCPFFLHDNGTQIVDEEAAVRAIESD